MAQCVVSAATRIISREVSFRIIQVRFRKWQLASGIWNPRIFENMKKPRELPKEYLDFLADGTCRTPINFGIHDGTPLGALPTDYLIWLSNDFRSDTINWRWWRDVARETLKERRSVHIQKRKEFTTALIRAGNIDYSLELLATECNQVDLPAGYAELIAYCRDHRKLELGIKAHNQITRAGFSRNSYIAELLMDMYCKCGMLELAFQVFQELPEKKLVSSWVALIRCYVDSGEYKQAIEAYKRMDLEPDQELLILMFQCCTRAGALAEGKVIHACLLSSEVRIDAGLRGAIFEFYARCGDLEVACKVFNGLEKPKAREWNVLMEAYLGAGNRAAAVDAFRRMERRVRNAESFEIVLRACENVEQIQRLELEFLSSKVKNDPDVPKAIQLAKAKLLASRV